MRNSVLIVVFLFLFTNCKNRIVEEYIYNECKTLLNNKDTVGIIDLSSIKQFSWDTLYYFSIGSSYDEILSTLPSREPPYIVFDLKLYFYNKQNLVYYEFWPVFTKRKIKIGIVLDSTQFTTDRANAKFKVSIINNNTFFLYPLLNPVMLQK